MVIPNSTADILEEVHLVSCPLTNRAPTADHFAIGQSLDPALHHLGSDNLGGPAQGGSETTDQSLVTYLLQVAPLLSQGPFKLKIITLSLIVLFSANAHGMEWRDCSHSEYKI